MTTQIGNIKHDKEKSIIKSSTSLYCDTFYFTDIFNDKMYKSFIENVEKEVRRSVYYLNYIKNLRSTIEILNRDAIQSNITTADVDLEFHHYPLSLFQIVETVLSKALHEKRKITTFNIAHEVCQLHFNHEVGLVSLHEQNHKLQHDEYLFINTKQVFGNYTSFLKRYDKYLSTDVKQKINCINEMSEKNITHDIKGVF